MSKKSRRDLGRVIITTLVVLLEFSSLAPALLVRVSLPELASGLPAVPAAQAVVLATGAFSSFAR